jgi:hypothetical protein
VSAVSRAVLALALVAAPLAAQAPGLPVHGGGFRRGVEAVATIGWAGASSFTGDGTAYAGTLAYGWSRLGLGATVGGFDGDALSTATVGLQAFIRLLGDGVETPFEVGAFGGVGALWGVGCPLEGESSGPCETGDETRVPLGGSVAVVITTPYVSIRPWLAPRAEILGSGTRFAGSTGVDLRFAGGFGARVMWDQVDGYDQTLGVGLSYRF